MKRSDQKTKTKTTKEKVRTFHMKRTYLKKKVEKLRKMK